MRALKCNLCDTTFDEGLLISMKSFVLTHGVTVTPKVSPCCQSENWEVAAITDSKEVETKEGGFV